MVCHNDKLKTAKCSLQKADLTAVGVTRLQIDATTLLPPDDSARGFDNIAGSLTISPTLLEAYMTAATRVARTAVGHVGVGLSQGMQADHDGTLEVTVPVKAGTHMVGATFLATNYRPSLDLIKQYERKSLENNSIPQLQYYPAIGLMRIQGPFAATRPEDSRSIRKVFTCRPANQEKPCAKEILSTLMRRAFRRPTTQDLEWVWISYLEGRQVDV